MRPAAAEPVGPGVCRRASERTSFDLASEMSGRQAGTRRQDGRRSGPIGRARYNDQDDEDARGPIENQLSRGAGAETHDERKRKPTKTNRSSSKRIQELATQTASGGGRFISFDQFVALGFAVGRPER
jgi:hypothetical protein